MFIPIIINNIMKNFVPRDEKPTLRSNLKIIRDICLLLNIILISGCNPFDPSTAASIFGENTIQAQITSTISPLKISNQSNYSVSGSCTKIDQLDIYIGSTKLVTVSCSAGNWIANLDAALVADGNYELNLKEKDSSAILDSRSVLKDTVAPSLAGVIADGISNSSTTDSPSLSWNAASDSFSGVQKYQIALGATGGGTDILNWTDLGLDNSTTLTGLTLISGSTYYSSVRAVDVVGNTSPAISGDGWQVLVGTGVAIVTAGLPGSPSAANSISLAVGGTDVVAYRYKIGLQSSTDCTSSAGYSVEALIGDPLIANIENFNDGNFIVCLVGRDTNGNYQSYSLPTSYAWVRNAPAQIQFTTLEQVVDEDLAGTRSFSFSLNHTKSEDVIVEYELQGTAIFGLNHTLYSNTVTILAGSLSASVSFEVFGDTNPLPEKYFRVFIDNFDPAKLSLGANKTHTVIIKDNDSGAYKQIIEISYGQNHGCLIYTNAITNNDLYCWGDNRYGQLGNNSSYDSAQPVFVGSGYSKVSTNGLHTCAIKDNSLWCWGGNGSGQLGVNNTTTYYTPQAVDSAVSYVSVSTGYRHTCGITTTGLLKCWGSNQWGKLGDGTTTQRNLPVAIDAGTNYSLVSTGYSHTCGVVGLAPGGALKCWGANDDWQLGDSSLPNQLLPYPVDSGTSYKFISAGAFGNCGITLADDLKCWGANYNGEVGDIANSYPIPTVVDPGSKYSFVNMGIEITYYEPHTCGVTTSNEVKCWGGDGGLGRIGMGKNWSDYLLPTGVDPGVAYSKVFAGSYNSCGLTLAGLPKCWGSSEQSQSISIEGVIKTPTAFYPERNFKSVWVQNGGCAIDSLDKAWCWGAPENSDVPESHLVRRDSANTFKAATSNCVIQSDGVLKCYQGAWVDVDPGVTYKSIAQGVSHYCGITSLDYLKCWGTNWYGQVGDGTTITVNAPTRIDDPNTYKKVAAGATHTCAIDINNKVKCWGLGDTGQLGDGTNTQRLTPTPISDSATDYIDISAGANFSCGVTSTNQAKCWGYNSDGQLGNGTATSQSSPVLVNSVLSYAQISAGYNFACAITTVNKLQCWGQNVYTFLGINTPASFLGTGNYNARETSPVDIDASVNYSQVFVSNNGRTACAITTGQKLKCWGQASSEYNPNLPTGIDPYRPNSAINVLHPSM